MQRLTKFYQKYTHVMRGRYGRLDQVNKALLIFWAVMMIFDRWIPFYIGNILAIAAFVIVLYRFCSKKFIQEVMKTKSLSNGSPKSKTFSRGKRETYRYFKCPECKQKMRAPKGRGKIKVTCKNCHKQFIKKV